MKTRTLPSKRSPRKSRRPLRPPKPSTNGHAQPAAPVQQRPEAARYPPSADGPVAEGKDPATGRFVAGNKCGKGNPHFRALARNRTLFLVAAGSTQVYEIAHKLVQLALAGNVEAARLVLLYAVGRPTPAVNPDAADEDAWQRHAASPLFAEVCAAAQRDGFAAALAMLAKIQQAEEPKPLVMPLAEALTQSERGGH